MSRKFGYAGVKIAKYSTKAAEHGDTVVLEGAHPVDAGRTLQNVLNGNNKGGRPETSTDSTVKNNLAKAIREVNHTPRAHGPSHASRGIYRKRKGQ